MTTRPCPQMPLYGFSITRISTSFWSGLWWHLLCHKLQVKSSQNIVLTLRQLILYGQVFGETNLLYDWKESYNFLEVRRCIFIGTNNDIKTNSWDSFGVTKQESKENSRVSCNSDCDGGSREILAMLDTKWLFSLCFGGQSWVPVKHAVRRTKSQCKTSVSSASLSLQC